jgi:hypothetical protein
MFWRSLFPLVFLYAIIDGVITNYFFPAKEPYIFRDVFIVVVYLFFMMNEPFMQRTGQLHRAFGPEAWFTAMAFLLLSFGQIFNPQSPGLLLGILGFRVLFLYWPLALLAYVYFDRFDKVMGFFKMILYVSIPVNIFGLAQYMIGPQILYAVYGPKIERAIVLAALGNQTLEESYLRVIGTFASTGQYGNFLALSTLLGFAVLFSNIRRNEKIFFAVCQLLNFAALLASGTRSSFVFMVLSLGVFFMVSKNTRPAIATILFSGILMFGAFSLLGGRVVARFGSLTEMKMVRERTSGSMVKMYLETLDKYPMGKGLGSASTAAVHLGKTEASTFQFIENYPTKLQYEGGVGGVFLYYLFAVLLLKRWFGTWLPRFEKRYATALTIISCYCFIQFSVAGVFFLVDNPPVPIFLWALVGIAARFSMPETLADYGYEPDPGPSRYAYRTS